MEDPTITVDPALRTRLEALMPVLDAMEDPQRYAQARHGVEAVCDKTGKIIPGILKFSPENGGNGKSASITACTHHNEPCGLEAQRDFIQRWEQGERPEGTVYLVIGGELSRIREFYAHLFDDDRSMTLSELTDYRLFPCTHNGDERLNYNRIEMDYRENPEQNSRSRRAHDLYHAVYSKTAGNDLGLHSLSQEGPPMMITHHYQGAKPEETIRKIAGETEYMGIGQVLVDLVQGMHGHPMIGASENEEAHIPCVIEAGGPHLSESILDKAVEIAQGFIQSRISDKGLPETEQTSADYYCNATSVFTPSAAGPIGDHAGCQPDSYIMMQGPVILEQTQWGPDALDAVAQVKAEESLYEGMQHNFNYVEEGTPLAIGKEHGTIIRAPRSGYVTMAPKSPEVPADQTEAIVFIFGSCLDQHLTPQSTPLHQAHQGHSSQPPSAIRQAF